MMAAIRAAEMSAKVTLLEKNEKLGKKLFITGKGRCNVTNACPVEDLFSHVLTNDKFLYGSFYTCTNDAVMAFFEENGVPLKIERGERVFPVSDHASDIIKGLKRALKKNHVTVRLDSQVKDVCIRDGAFSSVILEDGTEIAADACIVATGGLSYASTGSTGDGYRFAQKAGHTLSDCLPALVPLNCSGSVCQKLMGLSLKNVSITVKDGKKTLYEDFGEMLFTHFGLSGPVILSASGVIAKTLKKKPLSLEIDLKPALDEEKLDGRLLRMFEENINRQFKNAVHGLFPAKLTPVMIECSGIPEDKPVHSITKEERRHFVHLIKHFPVNLTGLRSFDEAIITKGGVKVKEIDPSTMMSKKVKNLFFAGEVLDLDAVTGGFNLQIAWSTGFVAGEGAASADD